jgi:cation transport ATPase
MIFNMLQMGGNISLGIILTYSILVGVGLIASVLLLKLGLRFVKAERRRTFKWTAMSFFLQVLVIFMMGSPFILLGFAKALNDKGPPMGIIIVMVVIAVFIDMNVINVIHRTGLFKSLWPFLLMAIPIATTIAFGIMIERVGLFIPI